jgi:hypothetical protein
VRITEINGRDGRPETINVTARGSAVDITLRFDVASAETTRMSPGPFGNGGAGRSGRSGGAGGGARSDIAATRGVNFLQLQGRYTVAGRAGSQAINFSTPGAAETFRGD